MRVEPKPGIEVSWRNEWMLWLLSRSRSHISLNLTFFILYSLCLYLRTAAQFLSHTHTHTDTRTHKHKQTRTHTHTLLYPHTGETWVTLFSWIYNLCWTSKILSEKLKHQGDNIVYLWGKKHIAIWHQMYVQLVQTSLIYPSQTTCIFFLSDWKHKICLHKIWSCYILCRETFSLIRLTVCCGVKMPTCVCTETLLL